MKVTKTQNFKNLSKTLQKNYLNQEKLLFFFLIFPTLLTNKKNDQYTKC